MVVIGPHFYRGMSRTHSVASVGSSVVLLPWVFGVQEVNNRKGLSFWREGGPQSCAIRIRLARAVFQMATYNATLSGSNHFIDPFVPNEETGCSRPRRPVLHVGLLVNYKNRLRFTVNICIVLSIEHNSPLNQGDQT